MQPDTGSDAWLKETELYAAACEEEIRAIERRIEGLKMMAVQIGSPMQQKRDQDIEAARREIRTWCARRNAAREQLLIDDPHDMAWSLKHQKIRAQAARTGNMIDPDDGWADVDPSYSPCCPH